MEEEKLSDRGLNKLVEVVKSYSDLDEKRLREMVDHIPVRLFRKGRHLMEQGEVTKYCYFVLEGCARKFFVDEEGKEVTSEFYTENQTIAIFTEENLSPSPYSVVCLEDTLVIVGALDDQDNELEKYPEFESIVLKMMGADMGQLQATFASFMGKSPEERVKYIISKRPELLTRVPQHQLASYLGMTPESLSRIKGRLGQGHLKAVD